MSADVVSDQSSEMARDSFWSFLKERGFSHPSVVVGIAFVCFLAKVFLDVIFSGALRSDIAVITSAACLLVVAIAAAPPCARSKRRFWLMSIAWCLVFACASVVCMRLSYMGAASLLAALSGMVESGIIVGIASFVQYLVLSFVLLLLVVLTLWWVGYLRLNVLKTAVGFQSLLLSTAIMAGITLLVSGVLGSLGLQDGLKPGTFTFGGIVATAASSIPLFAAVVALLTLGFPDSDNEVKRPPFVVVYAHLSVKAVVLALVLASALSGIMVAFPSLRPGGIFLFYQGSYGLIESMALAGNNKTMALTSEGVAVDASSVVLGAAAEALGGFIVLWCAFLLVALACILVCRTKVFQSFQACDGGDSADPEASDNNETSDNNEASENNEASQGSDVSEEDAVVSSEEDSDQASLGSVAHSSCWNRGRWIAVLLLASFISASAFEGAVISAYFSLSSGGYSISPLGNIILLCCTGALSAGLMSLLVSGLMDEDC